RPAEVRLAEVRPAEVRLTEVRPAEVRPAEVRRDEPRPAAEIRPAEARLADARPAEGRPAEALPADSRLADARPAEVHPIGVPVTPRVPGGDPLLEQCDVLVVRHGSTLSATTLFCDGLAMRSIRLASMRTDARVRGLHTRRRDGVRQELAAGNVLE